MWQRRLGVLRLLKAQASPAKQLQTRNLVNRVNGTSSATRFARFWNAQSASPDDVTRSCSELVKERSGDVFLLQALSKRFHESAEEFFPPQIDEILGCFAELGHADEPFLAGFIGRLDDVIADASPRRVVRLLRNGAILQLEPDAWLSFVLPQLHRHLPNLREGVPSVLGSLHALRLDDAELIDLLATQGLLVARKSDDGFFARLFEQWSRHGASHEEMEGRGRELAGSCIEAFDIRDSLNLLAGLVRCGAAEASTLEGQLEDKLRGAALEDAVVALLWMRRLSLRSARLWQVCGDSVELALKNQKFVRDHLPESMDTLASLGGAGAEGEAEATLVASLLSAAETQKALPRYPAHKALQLLRAAALTADKEGLDAKVVAALPLREAAMQVARMGQQLTLWERRAARQAAELIDDVGKRHGLSLEAEISGLRSLSSLPLPPLIGAHEAEEEDWTLVQAGPELLLTADGDAAAVRFAGHGDAFAAPPGAAVQPTPSCRMAMRVAELHGWKIELRA